MKIRNDYTCIEHEHEALGHAITELKKRECDMPVSLVHDRDLMKRHLTEVDLLVKILERVKGDICTFERRKSAVAILNHLIERGGVLPADTFLFEENK